MTGFVKSLQFDRGFGFIVGQDGVERFFHASGVEDANGGSRYAAFQGLIEGENVTFEEEPSEKGPRAHRVQPVVKRERQDPSPSAEAAIVTTPAIEPREKEE